MDKIICHDKEDAKRYGDAIGWQYIDTCEYDPEGPVILILNCSVVDILERMTNEDNGRKL